jgi:outer membrane protein with beta-barrel domain
MLSISCNIFVASWDFLKINNSEYLEILILSRNFTGYFNQLFMKIKFLLALLFVVGLGFTSMAQTISIGPRLGVNFATQKISGSDEDFADNWNDEVKSNAGLQIGAVANVMVNDMFSIQPELLFVQKGYKFEEDELSIKGKYSYLEVPVLAKLSFGTGDIQGFVTAGPTLGYWMSGKDVVEFDGDSDESDVDFGDDEDGIENRAELGANIGVGLAYKLGAGALNFDVRYGAGFSSTYDSEDDAKLRNSGVSISVAYLFGL